jgi:hypothetical protein
MWLIRRCAMRRLWGEEGLGGILIKVSIIYTGCYYLANEGIAVFPSQIGGIGYNSDYECSHIESLFMGRSSCLRLFNCKFLKIVLRYVGFSYCRLPEAPNTATYSVN